METHQGGDPGDCFSSRDLIQPPPCHKSNRESGAVITQHLRDSKYVLISVSHLWFPARYRISGFTFNSALPVSGYRQKHICCSPICTEDEADQAPKVCQCIHYTTPGEYFSLFLLPFLAVLPEQGTEVLSTQLWQYQMSTISSYLLSNWHGASNKILV